MTTRNINWVMVFALALGLGCGAADDKDKGTQGGAGGPGVQPPGGMQMPGGPSVGTPTAGNTGATAGNGPVTTAGGGGSGPSTVEAGSMGMEKPDDMPNTMMPEECQGFSFEGIKYSPGGDKLPNTCMPFDATLNNPYAVRCVDVWPWYKTEYPGDNFCILPPPPELGIQYGVHPQGVKWFEQVSAGDMSGYENPTDDFVMEDGQEEEQNYLTTAANTAEVKFYRNYARMRGGSHHMIVSWDTASGAVGTWGPGAAVGLNGNSLPGAQRPDENAPKSLQKPNEDKGLYSVMGANPFVTFNMHHFNIAGKPILKEAWTNLWFEEDATTRVYGILGLNYVQVALLNVPAGTTQDLHYSWDITEPIRIVTIFGHRHAWTTNFSSWIEKPGGENQILYQSYDWYDEPTYRYDSMTMNPTPAPDKRMDGATTGVLMVQPGEKLHFNCHIEFTDERAAAVNGPAPNTIGALRFANQAFNAEMCILFGSTAAVRLANPVEDATPLPDFAKR